MDITVYKLLLGERDELASFQLDDAFRCSNGGKCPTTTCKGLFFIDVKYNILEKNDTQVYNKSFFIKYTYHTALDL
jgi:hypothetical protein